LVLACTFSAQVEAGEPRFVSKFIREKTLDPFSTILWLKAGHMHYTTVRMRTKNDPYTKTMAVDVLLADSNCSKMPALDPKFLDGLRGVSKQLFPAAIFGEAKGFRLPAQNSFNDCLFHSLYYQAHVINPLVMEDGTIRFRPHPRDCQRDAARLRSFQSVSSRCRHYRNTVDILLATPALPARESLTSSSPLYLIFLS
jgi:hypothetical protein